MLGEKRIAHLKEISQDAVLAFFDEYICPTSCNRSLLSVQVKSQIEKGESGGNAQLLAEVRVLLASEGYNIPPAEVSSAVQGDPPEILTNLTSLLLRHGYDDHDRISQTIGRLESLAMGSKETYDTSPLKVLKETNVEDLEQFRSSLEVGEYPKPIEPLETFYKCHWNL